MLCTPCGEVDRPTSATGGRYSEESVPEAEGIDVKVPSTDNAEMLVWVNACTEEVQNCRQIAASNTVILKE